MRDFSQLLMERSPKIVSQWVSAVAQSQSIDSTDGLSRSAIRDHIDYVLEALVTVLAQHQESDINQIISASLLHGKLRSEQGFDPDEIAQEYRLLRSTIRSNIQPELLQGTAQEVMRAVTMIDEVIDAAVAYCFRSYHTERVQELTQVQKQLNLTIAELTRLVKASQADLSMLAHELKSPLTAIIGYAELFLRQQSKQIDQGSLGYGAIERIMRASQRLLHLINDTLELARAGSDAMQLNLSEVDVTDLLSHVTEIMQPLALDRGLDLKVEIQDAPALVVTDSIKLQQILINLVSNSIQYTQQGIIQIRSWSLSSQTWAIAVTDTGFGIAPEEQQKIFNPFVRSQSGIELQSETSSGLGLAIVERLLQLLQGRIYIASQVGEGTTFTVILPTKLPTPGA